VCWHFRKACPNGHFSLSRDPLLVLVGRSYRRPLVLWYRLAYLPCFLLGWCLLGYCLYYGMLVQQAYAGYVLKSPKEPTDMPDTAVAIRGFLGSQRRDLEWALVSFGAWLALYLLWWVFNQEPEQEGG
jgi:hypothetical protein